MSSEVQAASLLTEIERKLIKTVIDRFLNLNELTPQRLLEVKFQDPDAVARLSRYGLIATTSNQKYEPRVVGIALCGDSDQIQRAKTALEIVLHVLRNLFEVELDRQDFTFGDLEKQARTIYDNVAVETLRLGVYLATEFPVFSSYNGTQFQIDLFCINNRILTINDIGVEWDRHVRERLQFLENARAPEKLDGFLSNFEHVARGDNELTQSSVERVAMSSGYQYDEIGLLLKSSEAEGLLVADPRAGTVKLTDAAIARARVVQRDRDAVAPKAAGPRTVFVVHGRNARVRNAVTKCLKDLGFEPIILQDRPNKGRTIIEKFEANANVEFAVVLLTPDDVGASASKPKKLRRRARQNVILELGYFIGRLGRDKVCPILAPDVETPSDIHGVVYVPFDSKGLWRRTLAKEIRESGIAVEVSKV
jgi:predicted nucleotide-binding protein